LTLWLDVDVEVSHLYEHRNERVAGPIEQADLAFHQRAQQGYAKLAARTDRIFFKKADATV